MFRGLEYERLPSFQERLSAMFPNAKVRRAQLDGLDHNMNVNPLKYGINCINGVIYLFP